MSNKRMLPGGTEPCPGVYLAGVMDGRTEGPDKAQVHFLPAGTHTEDLNPQAVVRLTVLPDGSTGVNCNYIGENKRCLVPEALVRGQVADLVKDVQENDPDSVLAYSDFQDNFFFLGKVVDEKEHQRLVDEMVQDPKRVAEIMKQARLDYHRLVTGCFFKQDVE